MLKSVSSSSLVLVISFGFRFVLTILLAKYLSGDGLGVYSWAVSAFGIATIFSNYGQDYFLLRKIPYYNSSSKGLIPAVLRHVQKQSCTNAFYLIIVIFPICYLSPYFLEKASSYSLEVMLIMLALPFASFSLSFSTTIRAYNFSLSGQIIEMIVQTGFLLALIIFVFGVFGYLIPEDRRTLLAISFFVFSWVLSCFISYCVYKHKIELPKTISPSKKEKKAWVTGQTSIVLGIIGGSVLGRSDIFLLAFLTTPSEIGAYFICLRLAEVLLFFGTVSYYVWGGELANLIQEGKVSAAQRILKKSSQICITSTFIMACFGFIFAEEVLSLVHERYANNANVFRIALSAFFIKGASGLMKPLFYILGEQKLLAKIQWIIGTFFTASIFLTVPMFGVAGCIALFAFCELGFFVFLVLRLYQKHNLSFSPV